MKDPIERQEAIDAFTDEIQITGLANAESVKAYVKLVVDRIKRLPSAQPEITKEYDLKKIYNIYVKIVQAHFVYQPSKPKAITAMPFDWLEVQNLLEKYLKDHGADFDTLCSEYISENVKDEHLPSAQPVALHINLNEPIKVKLTDWGKEIYYHQYDRINQIAGREICKPSFPKEDENGYTEFQLWCFIELYGMHMGMTLPNVIDPLEIVYERREE